MDSWRDSRSLSPFSDIPSKSNWREWSHDNYWEDYPYTPFRSTPEKRKSRSSWECLMCLHEFADRTTLRQHLLETGHNKLETKHRERSLQRTGNGDLKPRRKKGTVCRICGEEYRSFYDLKKHIQTSGHRWSYRKARLLSLQHFHDDEKMAPLKSLDGTSIPHSSGCFQSGERRNVSQNPENEDLLQEEQYMAYNIPEGSLQQERNVVVIPTKVNPSLQNNDPRRVEYHSKRLETRIERKPLDSDVPFIERSLDEHIPWRLIPLQKSAASSPVDKSYERPSKVSKIDMLDQLAERLKENTSASFIPKSRLICRSFSDVGPMPLSPLVTTSSSRVSKKSSSPGLDKTTKPISENTLKPPRKISATSSPTFDEPPSETGSLDSRDGATKLLSSSSEKSMASFAQNQKDIEDTSNHTAHHKPSIIAPSSTQKESSSYLPVPFPKSDSFCTSDNQDLSLLDSDSDTGKGTTKTTIGQDESLEDQMAILFGEEESCSSVDSSYSDSFLQPVTVRVEQVVENCQGCNCSLLINNIQVNYKTGDVTVFCGECGAYTIMEGVYQLR